MSRTWPWTTAILVGGLLLGGCPQRAPDGSPPPAERAETASDLDGAATRTVNLYFPGEDGRLHAEPRELAVAGDLEGQVTAVMEALIAGPRTHDLQPPLAEEITVGTVYVDGERIFLDLVSPDGTPPPPGGSEREILTVYSMVNTVLLSLPEEIQALVLLWNDQQPLTFMGNLNTAAPLYVNTDLIVEQP